jgi:hypothetical protein
VRIYIACHHPDPANQLAAALFAAGHIVTSTWHSGEGTRPEVSDAAAWKVKADNNCWQIEVSDCLVLVASPEHIVGTSRVPGGKFFEAGYAHGLRRDDGTYKVKVLTVGGIENGMLNTTGVSHAADTAGLLKILEAMK